MSYIYEKNGAKIYRKSFSIIRKETDLSNFNKLEEKVVVRMVHASGMTSISSQIYFSPNMVSIARHAIENGANILCDTNMIKYGITISRMPAKNKIMCMIKDDQIIKISKEIKNTRTAAGVELWRPVSFRFHSSYWQCSNSIISSFRNIKRKRLPKTSGNNRFPCRICWSF